MTDTVTKEQMQAILDELERPHWARAAYLTVPPATLRYITERAMMFEELVEGLEAAREWVEIAPEAPGLAASDEYEARNTLKEIDTLLTPRPIPQWRQEWLRPNCCRARSAAGKLELLKATKAPSSSASR